MKPVFHLRERKGHRWVQEIDVKVRTGETVIVWTPDEYKAAMFFTAKAAMGWAKLADALDILEVVGA